MSSRLQLQDLRRANDARDPALVELVVRLAQQPDEPPDKPVREGALTFESFLRETQGWPFRRKTREEQAHYRVETLKALEAPDAEVPLPDRLKAHEVIYALWQDDSLYARRALLDVIARVPLVYGPWRALKRIFKEAEAKGDVEIYGALAARFDMAFSRPGHHGGIKHGTLAYLVRRAWRFLRRTGVSLPACYADYCVQFLSHYTDETYWQRTWVSNHIFYHNTKKYNRTNFTLRSTGNMLANRAYGDLWTRTPRPLFSLLERARSEMARDYAVSALKNDFRAQLREVEASWVARLVGLNSKTVDDFVVWILKNVPRFEQGEFRKLGLHEAVLRLFDSPSDAARAYAAEYARTHARDLPVDELIRLANNTHPAVRKLAADLLLSRDPRKDVGLDAWGQLLETDQGHELAATVLRKHFGASELTPVWFKARLLSPAQPAFRFAEQQLPHIHPYEKLGAEFFVDLFETLGGPTGEEIRNNWGYGAQGWGARVSSFALEALQRFDVNKLNVDFLKRLALDPFLRQRGVAWINEGRLRTQTLGTDFFKLLAFAPAWDTDPWMTALKASNRPWVKTLTFDQSLSGQALAWLGDARRFSPSELGFDWLMQLVTRSEPEYHDFAVEVMIRAFRPADFAPKAAAAVQVPAAGEPVLVNLGGATFLFTGKLATMQRKEAEDKLEQAGGKALSAVSSKLQYLVVGDEGSPLYGQGKKGSKHVKAEEVNAAGGNIRIISETAFLEMLAGRKQEPASADATLAGSQRLWDMAIAPGQADAPLGAFARKYIRRHHTGIGQELSDRPVDPGAEIPESFFTFERTEPLFAESRKPVRDLALDLSRWEFARWSPPATALIRMAELPYGDVRAFVSQALLSEDAPEHKRYRISPDVLSPAAVYSFCESPDEGTRLLGMELIQRSPRLRLPEELFRLTESPDRKVRAFVIRALWSLYRDRGTTPDWKPYVPPKSTVGAAKKKPEEDRGPGTPHRPEQPPAPAQGMHEFFRRILFEIPPGRSDGGQGEAVEGISVRLKPLPARRAKLSLIEVMRDLAMEDAAFGGVIVPLLDEFMVSRGKSEHDACLVAATRIRHRHPALKGG